MSDPLPPITSRHNPRLKQAARLRDRRHRRATGRLLIDGARETARALQAGVRPVEAFVDTAAGGDAVAELERRNIPTFRVDSAVFEKLAYGERSDGVVLVAEARAATLSDLTLPSSPLIVVVERVEKPGNLGAILRTADGAGVDAVIVADPGVDLYNPNVIRASVGAVFRSGIAVTTAAEAVDWLTTLGTATLATRPNAARPYTEADLTGTTAVVLGSEADGLSDAWRDAEAVSLPMLGVADSLNVSAAAAVLLYEARRQRDAR